MLRDLFLVDFPRAVLCGCKWLSCQQIQSCQGPCIHYHKAAPCTSRVSEGLNKLPYFHVLCRYRDVLSPRTCRNMRNCYMEHYHPGVLFLVTNEVYI